MDRATELAEVLAAGWAEQRVLLLEMEGTTAARQVLDVVARMVYDERWLVGCLRAIERGRAPEPSDPEVRDRAVAALTQDLVGRPWRAVVDRAERAGAELRTALLALPPALLHDERLSPHLGDKLLATRVLDDALWKPLKCIAAALREDSHGELAILCYKRIARRLLTLPVAPFYHRDAMYLLAIAYRDERRYHEAIKMLRAAVSFDV